MVRILTNEEKRQFYRDGYFIVKGAISKELVDAALARIKSANKGENLGPTKEMLDLVNASDVTPVLNDMMGDFDAPGYALLRCRGSYGWTDYHRRTPGSAGRES